jgi:hypothetical protein
VLIRIIRNLPAPMMDGFDVRQFRVKQVYRVDARLGRYLVVAGYAVELTETATDRPRRKRR